MPEETASSFCPQPARPEKRKKMKRKQRMREWDERNLCPSVIK
jgi:hypothetical protein